MHPAFENAGQKKGLEIWRIESFQPVPYPKADYGKFFIGDSYIVLNTIDNKDMHVHFWLGAETTPDEAGSAAIFTVQLDDQLGGYPIQHREVQDHESSMFLKYFKNGIRYLPGGVSSGMTSVPEHETRLFHVKGKKNIRVKQVDLSISSMNQGDCFILDANENIYVYVGKQSKTMEKVKANAAANQIRDQDHGGRSKVIIIDQFSSSSEQKVFFEVLGSGSPDEVAADSGSDDETFEKSEARETALYKVSDASGHLQIDQISTKPLKQEMLDTNDCFILDTGAGIYVWVGKNATAQEKSQSLSRAQKFLESKSYPAWTKIERIVEGAETAPFKQYFQTWRDAAATTNLLLKLAFGKNIEDDIEFDPSMLHKLKKSGGRALGFMPDNGNGNVDIWRVEHMEIVPVDKENYGYFFGGDSYVIKYEYSGDKGPGYVIYYWQGLKSSIDEKAASAIHAVQLDNELNGKAVQVRVVQGFEPRHFLKMFKGKFVTFTGGKASGFKNIHDHDTYDVDGTRLFRIRGTDEDDVRADQMEEVAGSLASDDTFILETPSATYIWCGKGTSKFEKDMANKIVKVLSPKQTPKLISEGQEPDAFWSALGGKGDYDKEIDPAGAPFLDPRLFHCRVTTAGKFKVEEIAQFEQDDLNPDDIMVLDGGDEVYVWIGNGSTDEEKEKSLDMAKDYLRTDPTDRSEDTTPMIKVNQGAEPKSFKRLFPKWSDFLWESQGN